MNAAEMETEAPYYTWRRTSGAAPDAVKAARPVLNGELRHEVVSVIVVLDLVS